MPRLYLPIKPAFVNQGFGNDPVYYARFKDQLGHPMKGHMGIDYRAAHGTPVYAAHDGNAQFLRDEHGGEGVYLTGNGYRTIYWHLVGDTDANYPSPIPLNGTITAVTMGTLLGYADNTGAPYETSGTHLHFAFYFLEKGVVKNIGNGFNGAVDPTSYFTNIFAEDYQKKLTLYQKLLFILQALVGASAVKNK